MTHLLLAIIYLAFISLGLPDALLGAAWPSMQPEFGVPISYAGILSMIIAVGTVVSSLQSDRLTRRLGTGKVTAISVAMTAAALLGFSFTHSFWLLCLWAVPYGLGAGSVDASLNNYVALHYESKHMSWLHCMWGIGRSGKSAPRLPAGRPRKPARSSCARSYGSPARRRSCSASSATAPSSRRPACGPAAT